MLQTWARIAQKSTGVICKDLYHMLKFVIPEGLLRSHGNLVSALTQSRGDASSWGVYDDAWGGKMENTGRYHSQWRKTERAWPYRAPGSLRQVEKTQRATITNKTKQKWAKDWKLDCK